MTGRGESPIRRWTRPDGNTAWRETAACRNVPPDLMFPVTEHETWAALAVCHRCPVRAPCGIYAVGTGQMWGVWAGLAERDLRAAVHATGDGPPRIPAPTPFPGNTPRGPDPRRPAVAARAKAAAQAAALRAATPTPVLARSEPHP